MQKLIALFLVAALTTGCATVPNGSYETGTPQNGRQDTSNGPPQATSSFLNGNTIFWTVVTVLAVGAAAKAAGSKAGSNTCNTGPRGGTYTVTANGNKNYSGC